MIPFIVQTQSHKPNPTGKEFRIQNEPPNRPSVHTIRLVYRSTQGLVAIQPNPLPMAGKQLPPGPLTRQSYSYPCSRSHKCEHQSCQYPPTHSHIHQSCSYPAHMHAHTHVCVCACERDMHACLCGQRMSVHVCVCVCTLAHSCTFLHMHSLAHVHKTRTEDGPPSPSLKIHSSASRPVPGPA